VCFYVVAAVKDESEPRLALEQDGGIMDVATMEMREEGGESNAISRL